MSPLKLNKKVGIIPTQSEAKQKSWEAGSKIQRGFNSPGGNEKSWEAGSKIQRGFNSPGGNEKSWEAGSKTRRRF